MRILHVFKTYYPDSFGGVERTIHAIAKGAVAHDRFLSSIARIVVNSPNYVESSAVLHLNTQSSAAVIMEVSDSEPPISQPGPIDHS